VRISERFSRSAARAAVIVGAWTVYGLLHGAQSGIERALRGEPPVWLQTIAIWLACGYAWAAVTPFVLELARRFPLEPPRLAASIAAHLVGGSAAVAVNLALFAVLAPRLGAAREGASWLSTYGNLMGSTFLLDLLVYAILVGAAQTVRFARDARERERRALTLEAQQFPVKIPVNR
jgi:hypothetical protein